jgi:Leucine-rich repeat (LRR) protein
LASFASTQTEPVPVECSFVVTVAGRYACTFIGVTIENDVNLNFTIGGIHEEGRTNEDVIQVQIEFSNIPFIFKEIFETFPNLEFLTVIRGGLVTFQENAFFDARKLRVINFRDNVLPVFYPHAFVGATNVRILVLNGNDIEKLSKHALVGLNSLDFIVLDGNLIEEFPEDFFRPAIRLNTLDANLNRISRIHGDTFARKYQVESVRFASNQINAIGRRFLDNLNLKISFNFLRNVCINRLFVLGFTGTNAELEAELEPCFQNYDAMTEA